MMNLREIGRSRLAHGLRTVLILLIFFLTFFAKNAFYVPGVPSYHTF